MTSPHHNTAANRTVAVIGAGVGGIAAAIRLARQGRRVVVFEANDEPGGKLAELRVGGCRFDAGPSLFTMPSLVEDLFRLCGENPAERFHRQRLDTICRYFFADGSRLDASADPARFAAAAAALTGEPASRILSHLQASRKLYEATEDVFLKSSLHRLGTYLRPVALRTLLALPRLDMWRTMAQANAARFSDPRLRQLFNRYATYNGSSPYLAPATLNVIPHLEFNTGAYLPEGGMITIARSLAALAERHGVEFRHGSRVDEILLVRGTVAGVRCAGGGTFPCPVVVSNMDVTPTYRRLLPGQSAPERALRQPPSTSGLIFYWDVRGTFPELGLHNIFFSADYRAEFRALETGPDPPADPTIYLNISSKEIPADAPQGHDRRTLST